MYLPALENYRNTQGEEWEDLIILIKQREIKKAFVKQLRNRMLK